jgi:glycosyltransferase involved in cell wall biosynthesis
MSATLLAPAISSTRADARVNVCIVGNNLYPVFTGGGVQAMTLAREFKRLGHGVFFITKKHGDLPDYDQVDGLDIYRIKYENLPPWAIVPVISQLVSLTRVLMRFRDRYDVVLFFNPDGGMLHSWVLFPLLHLLGKKTATRMTLLNSSSDPAGLARKRFPGIRLLPYRLHHRVISISTALSMSYESVFGRDTRLVRITNGVDTRKFRPAEAGERDAERRALGLDPSLRYCTFVGRIGHRKGVDVLIEAWRDVAPKFPDARLLLVGPTREDYRQAHEAEYIAALEAKIGEYGIADSIVWTGKSDSVERYLRASDVFVFASRREGCPNALLEAMASGLPIVTTRIDHITEDLIRHGQDGLITPPDAAAFADALASVLASPSLGRGMGHSARRRTEAEFSIGRTAEKYIETLGSLKELGAHGIGCV